MTKGDIVKMPSGSVVQYLGGSEIGAQFVYLDAEGKPKKHRGELDTFCIVSIKLLSMIQPEYTRV